MIKRKTWKKTLTALSVAVVMVCCGGVFSACALFTDSGSSSDSGSDSGSGSGSGSDSGSTYTEETTASVERVTFTGFNFTYTPTDKIDFDDLTITVYYDDDTSRVVTKKEYDTPKANNSDTEVIISTSGLYDQVGLVSAMGGELPAGTYEITCTLLENNKTYNVGTVEITENIVKVLDVFAYENPEFLDEYNLNTIRTGDMDDDNCYVEKATEEDYSVGSDNAFEFAPRLTVMNVNTQATYEMTGYDVDVDVYLVEGENEQKLVLEENDYVSYADFAFKFTSAADGKKFKISMSPADFDEDAFGRAITPVEMVVNVESGWNVYDALDLGRINLVDSSADYAGCTDTTLPRAFWDTNSKTYTSYRPSDLWKPFLAENGKDESTLKATHGIFLHGNIEITQSDIPEEYFISEQEARDVGAYYANMIGSIRDMVYPYTHYMVDDFIFDGNLFTIDCSTLKYCLTEFKNSNYSDNKWGWLDYKADMSSVPTSNAALFCFSGLMDTSETPSVNPESRATVYIRNVEFYGNMSNPTYDIDAKGYGMAAGSLQAIKVLSSKIKMDNCIIREFVMGLHTQYTRDDYTCAVMDGVKILDCYNAGIYLWQSARNELKNSVIKRIGGPAVMAFSKTSDENNTYGYYFESGCSVDDKTVIENYIAGDEAWFVDNDLTFISSIIVGLDETFKAAGKTLYSGEINESGSDTINLKFVGADNGFGSDDSEYLNVNYSIGDAAFVSNEDDMKTAAGVRKSESDYESTEEYYSALTNYYGGYSLLGQNAKLVYTTNSGKIFTPCDDAILGLLGAFGVSLGTSGGSTDMYDLTKYAFDTTQTTPVELDETDTEVYLYILVDISLMSLTFQISVGCQLYDYTPSAN